MKVDSFAVESAASRSYVYAYEKKESFQSWTGARPATPLSTGDDPDQASILDITDRAKQQMRQLTQQDKNKMRELTQRDKNKMLEQSASVKIGAIRSPIAEDLRDLRIRMLEEILSRLTGKDYRIRTYSPQFNGGHNWGGPSGMHMGIRFAPTASARGGWGAVHSVSETIYESESVSYQAQGMVKTADGKTIAFDLKLDMSREFYQNVSGETKLGNAVPITCDPLVINFSGSAAQLTNRKFEFDLDVDGAKDNISFAGKGSGFLALDKNGDGTINDGSELFGPQSGNGFDDLRAYDSDGNGWIDENDDVYSQLRVWCKDENGNDELYTLKQLDIGAIYLGEQKTQFSVNDMANQTLGQVQSTSFFLKDSGGAGYIQHIDLAL